MNLEVWYALDNTKLSDIERLESIINTLEFKNKIKFLFKPFKETKCPHQEAAYILLKWAEKEYIGLDTLKKLLMLKEVEKSQVEEMAKSLGLCNDSVKSLFEGDAYRFDLKIDYVESRDFFIDQTTLMVGVDNILSITSSDEEIKAFLIDAYQNKKNKILACGHIGVCSDTKCGLKKNPEGVKKCK